MITVAPIVAFSMTGGLAIAWCVWSERHPDACRQGDLKRALPPWNVGASVDVPVGQHQVIEPERDCQPVQNRSSGLGE